jgi:hypothetical protein
VACPLRTVPQESEKTTAPSSDRGNRRAFLSRSRSAAPVDGALLTWGTAAPPQAISLSRSAAKTNAAVRDAANHGVRPPTFAPIALKGRHGKAQGRSPRAHPGWGSTRQRLPRRGWIEPLQGSCHETLANPGLRGEAPLTLGFAITPFQGVLRRFETPFAKRIFSRSERRRSSYTRSAQKPSPASGEGGELASRVGASAGGRAPFRRFQVPSEPRQEKVAISLREMKAKPPIDNTPPIFERPLAG